MIYIYIFSEGSLPYIYSFVSVYTHTHSICIIMFLLIRYLEVYKTVGVLYMYAYIYMYVFCLARTVCLVPMLKLMARFAVVILNCFNYLFRCYHSVFIH